MPMSSRMPWIAVAVAILAGPSSSTGQAAQASGQACLVLEKIAPQTVNWCLPLPYEIRVTNTGCGPALDVIIRDELPAASTLVSADPKPVQADKALVWTVARIESGQTLSFKVTIKPTAEGLIANTATVTYSLKTSTQTCVTRPKLQVVKEGPADEVCLGKPVEFKVRVANVGNGPADDLELVDELPAGLSATGAAAAVTQPIGTLAPGACQSFLVTAVAKAPGTHTNVVKVRAAKCACVDEAVASLAVKVVEPKLDLCKVGPAKAYQACAAKYTISVSNPGTGTAPNVVLTDHLPAGMEFVSASHNGTHDAASRTVVWALGALKPGEARAVVLMLRPVQLGRQCNKVTAYTCCGIAKEAEFCTDVEGKLGVLLEVTDDKDALCVGETVTYKIEVLNQGSQPLTNVEIVGTLDEAMTALSATGDSGTASGRTFSFTPKALAPGARLTYYVQAKGLKKADARIQVQLKAAELAAPVTELESTHFYE